MKKCLVLFCAIVLLASLPCQADDEPYISTRVLSEQLVNQAVMAAYKECQVRGYQVAVAVVDRSGGLVGFVRNPLAGTHTIEVSQRKAFAAATFQASTSSMMDRENLKQIPGVLLIGGGLPIRVAGHFYGAIGVSGAPGIKFSGDEDEACAKAGLATITEALEFAD